MDCVRPRRRVTCRSGKPRLVVIVPAAAGGRSPGESPTMSQPPLGRSTPLVPPLYQSSVYTLPDLDALDRIMNAEEPVSIYARDAHPTARLLAAELAAWEAADWAVICGSVMAAISAFLLAILQHGDRLLASNRLYVRTSQLLDQELGRF